MTSPNLKHLILAQLPEYHKEAKDEWWCEKCIQHRRDYFSHHDNFFCEKCGTKLTRRQYEQVVYDERHEILQEIRSKLESLDLSDWVRVSDVRKAVEKIEIERAHTYASENADMYRIYERGQQDMKKRVLASLSSPDTKSSENKI